MKEKEEAAFIDKERGERQISRQTDRYGGRERRKIKRHITIIK